MWKWILTIGIIGFLGGCLWLGNKYLEIFKQYYSLAEKKYELSQNIAWSNCIGNKDPSSAPNLVCRSLYPQSYKLWYNEFQGR